MQYPSFKTASKSSVAAARLDGVTHIPSAVRHLFIHFGCCALIPSPPGPASLLADITPQAPDIYHSLSQRRALGPHWTSIPRGPIQVIETTSGSDHNAQINNGNRVKCVPLSTIYISSCFISPHYLLIQIHSILEQVGVRMSCSNPCLQVVCGHQGSNPVPFSWELNTL